MSFVDRLPSPPSDYAEMIRRDGYDAGLTAGYKECAKALRESLAGVNAALEAAGDIVVLDLSPKDVEAALKKLTTELEDAARGIEDAMKVVR